MILKLDKKMNRLFIMAGIVTMLAGDAVIAAYVSLF